MSRIQLDLIERYGKLFALQEMQIHILSEIKKVKEQIEREEKNE
jgi:hypothetical protein